MMSEWWQEVANVMEPIAKGYGIGFKKFIDGFSVRYVNDDCGLDILLFRRAGSFSMRLHPRNDRWPAEVLPIH